MHIVIVNFVFLSLKNSSQGLRLLQFLAPYSGHCFTRGFSSNFIPRLSFLEDDRHTLIKFQVLFVNFLLALAIQIWREFIDLVDEHSLWCKRIVIVEVMEMPWNFQVHLEHARISSPILSFRLIIHLKPRVGRGHSLPNRR